jgi:hydroxypyruvate isomerase
VGKEQAVPRINQSFSWWCFSRGGVEPERLLREAARIGYAAVEMLGQEHWDAARAAGLRIAIIGGHGTLTDGLNKRENHGRIEQELLEKIELAVKYQIPGLICFSGNRYGVPDEACLDIMAEGLRRVTRVAEEKGINLCVELLNSKVDHPDYQVDRTPYGVALCERVGSPRVKLLYDIYHMQIMEGDLIRTIRDYGSHFGHYHTAGNPGRRDMDETQEIYYPAVMRAIAETGYDLFVGHEFVPKGDPVDALAAAYRVCNVEG